MAFWATELLTWVPYVQVMSILFEVESLRVREPRNILQVRFSMHQANTETCACACLLSDLGQFTAKLGFMRDVNAVSQVHAFVDPVDKHQADKGGGAHHRHPQVGLSCILKSGQTRMPAEIITSTNNMSTSIGSHNCLWRGMPPSRRDGPSSTALTSSMPSICILLNELSERSLSIGPASGKSHRANHETDSPTLALCHAGCQMS